MGNGSGDSSVPGEKQRSKVRVTGEWYQGCPCQQFHSTNNLVNGSFWTFSIQKPWWAFCSTSAIAAYHKSLFQPSCETAAMWEAPGLPMSEQSSSSGWHPEEQAEERGELSTHPESTARSHPLLERERKRERERPFNTQIWQYSTFTTIFKHK